MAIHHHLLLSAVRTLNRAFVRMALLASMGLCMGSMAVAADHPSEGQQACLQVMAGDPLAGLDGSRERHHAALTGAAPPALCACVGRHYAQHLPQPAGEDAQATTLSRAFAACLPPVATLAGPVRDMVSQGPLFARPPSAVQQQAETRLCQEIARGRHASATFDAPYVQAWEQESGLQAASLCGECVAAEMQQQRAQAQAEQGVWDAVRHEQKLVSALHQCQHFVYRMRVRIQN